ncbi:hypothetical protein GC163_07555 [bacterium]|nr:hypothetical protein [bacterium]
MMSAMEKMAWSEVVISGTATLCALALLPWLGPGAAGAFGLLGLLPCGSWFLRRRGTAVITDERDHDNEKRATFLGILTAWQVTFMSLIAMVLWTVSQNRDIPAAWLNWLIWVQFALCYLVKGCAFLLINRRQHRATAC